MPLKGLQLALSPIQKWKESTDIIVRSIQGYDLGLAFLSWVRLRNASCFDNLCTFFQDNFHALGTLPEEGLLAQCTNEPFVQLAVPFVTTSGEYNLNGASHPATEEAELKGNTQKQAGMMPCTQAVRSS